MNSRRDFLKNLGLTAAGVALMPSLDLLAAPKNWFDISLAEWSLHKTLFKGDLKNIDFPELAAKKFGIYGVEYVNAFFKDKAKDMTYLKDLNNRAKDNGVRNVLIMIDGEGNLGDEDATKRKQAVENHYKWIDAAHFLGCHAVRVNAAGKGTPEEVKKAVVDSLSTLADYGKKSKISVIVENHGGISSHGDWLADTLKTVGKKNCGSLPDLGNFYEYDRYQGVADLMPYAKGVSAKTHDFDANGNETQIDYARMLKIVKDAKFKGYIGIEYEGSKLSEEEGIFATKKLLERLRPTI
ncbi:MULTISPECIES: sugar phosphate isomerase/epimerase family protein [Sphingobacterium]|jgi:sugar phosphate isomerase/epimerase|uniref:sugar phosphate isomerase/epimerase family protein n=1 Tax=Sphingobacterium TaxID=28453 RepID=UPI0004E5EF0E|nr:MULTISPECIES: sugar phosphate isomerase/epimerase family protein [Sphingobacterium]CDS92765.1 AP endonuclease [Sphingobacterium sp. PM2-P1-29]HCU46451.1 sugar phosphate isomerase/epimerase [Sphingobacterium sp.]UPZ36626.1 sugar phosphate isomerase/epimerase [Sphingobacterium sp. PCS056]UXD68143.1 sugar phosphate isomerase/epimerase [Sphingobacterium faecium]WGQ15854.1 sugar phosphate isomerase/epimerase family protein [Sphingobacterium faecium]